MAQHYTRWQKQAIEQAINFRRVVLLAGARQCGKTTLAKQLAKPDTVYRTLDDINLQAFAKIDPQNFVKHHSGLLIIDKVQRVPTLLPAIKMVVDNDTRPGQYLLTCSTNLQSLPGVQESLAGRISKIRLRPLSQGEIIGTKPAFLENAFKQSFTIHDSPFDRQQLLHMAFRGGFPEAIQLNDNERARWHRDYINALLERDLKDISKITRFSAMQELTRILAAWSSKFLDISSICSSLAVSRNTIESYINALESLYIVERLSAWTRTDYERVGKRTKIYMTDCGLMSSIMRWQIAQVELDSDRSGKLIETFLFNELAALVDASIDKYELFHYRDREQHEIDFLIERNDGALLGIEVKAGSAISKSDIKHLKWFKENIAKDRTFIGIVLYTGNLAGSMGENLWAVPISALWA